jgi:outer membrane protein TolC
MSPATKRLMLIISLLFGTLRGASAEPAANPAEASSQEREAILAEAERLAPLQEEGPEPANAPVPMDGEVGIGLAQILDLALQHNPRIAVESAKAGESQMRALATGLLPNPEVEAGVKELSREGSGPVIGVHQELPVNGVLGLERRAADLESMADRAQFQRHIQEVLAEVERAYVEVLAARELAEIGRRGMSIAEESLNLLSESLKAGLVSELPLRLAQAEYANAKNASAIADQDLLLARHSLAGLLAMEEKSLPPVIGGLRDSFLSQDSDEERADRRDLRAANLRVQAAQSSTAAAQRARVPNPVIGYEREEAGSEVEDSFTLALEIPLLNNGRPAVRAHSAREKAVQAEKDALAKEILIEAQRAASEVEMRRATVQIYEKEIHPSIEQSLTAARAAFESGTTDLSLLLQTQTRLVEQERDYVRAVRDLRNAEVSYRLALGAPRN